MKTHGISEAEALEMIKKWAISKRMSIENMAQAFINANELSSGNLGGIISRAVSGQRRPPAETTELASKP